MLIQCEKCQTRYRFRPPATAPSLMKMRCSKCDHVFEVALLREEDDPVVLAEEAIVVDGPKILTVSNQKGGVAKTSTTVNLAASLAAAGQRVLMVDFDMQASLSITLGYSNQARSFYDLVHGDNIGLIDVITKTSYANLWLLPANPNLALLAKKNVNSKEFEHILARRLAEIKGSIDYIIIDTPPSIEFFTLNALMASSAVIIPSQCEYLSMHGVGHIIEAIESINRLQDKDLTFRVLITMFAEDNTAAQVILKKLRENYGERVFSTMIAYDTKVQEAQIMNKPLVAYAPDSSASLQFVELAREIMESDI